MNPYRLTQDGEGHWYLVPESKLVAFESALSLLESDQSDKTLKIWNKARKDSIELDSPSSVRILSFELT